MGSRLSLLGVLMNAVRVRKHVDSDTLHLPELRPMIGKDVEIIVIEDSEAPRNAAPDVQKLRELAGQIDFDYEAFEQLREISTL